MDWLNNFLVKWIDLILFLNSLEELSYFAINLLEIHVALSLLLSVFSAFTLCFWQLCSQTPQLLMTHVYLYSLQCAENGWKNYKIGQYAIFLHAPLYSHIHACTQTHTYTHTDNITKLGSCDACHAVKETSKLCVATQGWLILAAQWWNRMTTTE